METKAERIPFPDCQIVGIYGPVASGKTYLIKQLIAPCNRVLAFDYSGEMQDGMTTIMASPLNAYRRIRKNPHYFRIAYIPGRDVDSDFEQILWVLWHTPVSKQLVIDEVHRIMPVSGMSNAGETALRFARHNYLGILAASQRIADVSKLLTSSSRTTILFKTQEIRDLDAIDDRWGCAKEVEGLSGLVYDDITKVTKQRPQCVVCTRGQAPRVVQL